MPCMSYDDDPHASSREWKKQTDKLARIACKAMTELVKHGKADFLILQDEEVRKWWEQHQAADRRAREMRERKEREARVRSEALSKLTDEEKKVLRIKE